MGEENKRTKPTIFTRGSNIPEPTKIPPMPKNVKPPKEEKSNSKSS